jgi:integrase
MTEQVQARKKTRGMGRTFKPKYKRADGTAYECSTWWIGYYHRGKEIRESSESQNEALARKLLRQRLGELSQGKVIRNAEKVTFEQLAEDLRNDYITNDKRSLRSADLSIKHLRESFGGDRAPDVSTDRIRSYIAKRQREIAERRKEIARRKREEASRKRQKARFSNGHGAALLEKALWLEQESEELERKKPSNASINRELSALKRMFKLAIQAEKIYSSPHIPGLEEHNARQGFFDHGSFLTIRENLPDYLRDPVTFLYYSGWRIGEMKGLRWADVDLEGKVVRLRPDISKNKDGRVLPLAVFGETSELLEIFERAWETRRPDCPFVFQLEGEPVGDIRKSWKRATRAAGLMGRVPHDFRRTAVRNLVRAGVREKVAMAITGHKTRSIFDRYNIVDEADLAEALEKVQSYLQKQPKRAKVAVLRRSETREHA